MGLLVGNKSNFERCINRGKKRRTGRTAVDSRDLLIGGDEGNHGWKVEEETMMKEPNRLKRLGKTVRRCIDSYVGCWFIGGCICG